MTAFCCVLLDIFARTVPFSRFDVRFSHLIYLALYGEVLHFEVSLHLYSPEIQKSVTTTLPGHQQSLVVLSCHTLPPSFQTCAKEQLFIRRQVELTLNL